MRNWFRKKLARFATGILDRLAEKEAEDSLYEARPTFLLLSLWQYHTDKLRAIERDLERIARQNLAVLLSEEEAGATL